MRPAFLLFALLVIAGCSERVVLVDRVDTTTWSWRCDTLGHPIADSLVIVQRVRQDTVVTSGWHVRDGIFYNQTKGHGQEVIFRVLRVSDSRGCPLYDPAGDAQRAAEHRREVIARAFAEKDTCR